MRSGVGAFDGAWESSSCGPGALDPDPRVTSNGASKLTVGKVQYSCLPNGKGGIVDDRWFYRMENEKGPHYLLVVNASTSTKGLGVDQQTGTPSMRNWRIGAIT